MRRLLRTIAPALALTALVVAVGAFSAGAQERGGGSDDAKVFGAGDSQLKPFCKKSRERGTCQAVASLTTFIKTLGNKKNPFVAPSDGKIVAWAIELGHKPSKRPPEDSPDAMSNLEIFQDLFGNERYGNGPVARLAILRRQGGVRFKLADQSPVVKLTGPFYDSDTVITLERPLPIKEGEIVGLSSLTWIPMLRPQGEGGGKASWRASLTRGDCDGEGILNGKPQKRVGSTREYGCQFDDRLFYKAYFVPN